MPPEASPANAADIARRAELSGDARAVLGDGMPPPKYLDALMQKDLMDDAYAFVAHWLPRRQAVWWGCQCVWNLYRPTAAESEAAALRATVRWVQDPSERNRRACEAAARTAGTTPAGALAQAAFFSSGSLAPANQPDVPPPPELTPKAIGQAVLLAAVNMPADRQPEYHAQCLALAGDISQGKHSWNPEKS
jgi:hypothetical protein